VHRVTVTDWIGMRVASVAAATVAMVLASPIATAADGICIVCSEPSATYRCVVDDAAAAGSAAERAGQFVCISEIAQRNRHGICWVRRDLVGGCDAPEQRVSVRAAIPVLPAAPGAAAPSVTAPKPVIDVPGRDASTPIVPAGAGVPQTMEEVAKRTAAASSRSLEQANTTVKSSVTTAGDAIKNTGSAVGSAFEQTWTCVASLFKRCGTSSK
jgi:hypothetical protein